MWRSSDRVAKHLLCVILVWLTKFQGSSVHPIGLFAEKGSSQPWFQVTTLHSGEDFPVIYRWKIMWVVPCCGVVDSSAVLKCHDIHLVETYLRHVGVRTDVDMLRRDQSEGDRWSIGRFSCRYELGDARDGVNGSIIQINEDGPWS